MGGLRDGLPARAIRRLAPDAIFREIARHDQEGIVAKRMNAPYRAGRQPTWLKIKNRDYSRRGAVEWQGGRSRGEAAFA